MKKFNFTFYWKRAFFIAFTTIDEHRKTHELKKTIVPPHEMPMRSLKRGNLDESKA